MNRGIVIAVESISFNQDTSKVEITMSDPKLHGLLDGGHTYNIILEERSDGDEQYVKVEFLEGFSLEDITNIVDARNTSNQVRDESLLNLADKFDELKKELKGASYFNKIAFKEYEVDDKDEPKPIEIREIIGILMSFDKDNFKDSPHPVNAYSSKAACISHFATHGESFKKIYPLADEILRLYNRIQLMLPELYNSTRPNGAFGKLTGVSYRKGKEFYELQYLGKKAKYGVPDGFVYPILGAFRALLEESNGSYVWAKSLKPEKLLDGPLGKKLAETIGNYALENRNPSKTGKSPLVWEACYTAVENAFLKA
jgi:hypothetical protein